MNANENAWTPEIEKEVDDAIIRKIDTLLPEDNARVGEWFSLGLWVYGFQTKVANLLHHIFESPVRPTWRGVVLYARVLWEMVHWKIRGERTDFMCQAMVAAFLCDSRLWEKKNAEAEAA